jgi:hypothetical protein
VKHNFKEQKRGVQMLFKQHGTVIERFPDLSEISANNRAVREAIEKWPADLAEGFETGKT